MDEDDVETEIIDEGPDERPDIEELLNGLDADVLTALNTAPETIEIAGEEAEIDEVRRLMLGLLYTRKGKDTVDTLLGNNVSPIQEQVENVISELWDKRDQL